MPVPSYLSALAPVVTGVVAPSAVDVDRDGAFPQAAIDALGQAGLLGLVSSADVGGLGEGPRAAALVVEELARHCGSTAMVVMMHYCATTVLEAHGPEAVRKQIAAGTYLASLAFSEVGSRSQFWAPMSTATAVDAGPSGKQGAVRLDARKSWVTSAGHAAGYVWSSRPVVGEDPSGPQSGATVPSTVWLVRAGSGGLEVGPPFDGLGLRGNSSTPMTATGVEVPADAMLGPDGGGFDIMLGAVLPYFQVLSAAFSCGTMDAATTKSAAHAVSTRLEHLDQSLADNPVVRANVARMRVKADMARGLLLDTLRAMNTGQPDAMRKVLEVKAAAGEASIEVTDLAMRVCGGSAFRKEVGVERHFRDARAATVMAPTTDALYDFIGRLLCDLPLF